MPSFCRHNRLIQNCSICSREQSIEARPVVSSSAPRSSLPRTPSHTPRERGGERRGTARGTGARGTGGRGGAGVRVRQLARGAEDGYRSPLVPGLRSSADAERLALELTLAVARLQLLSAAPPGLYAEIADGGRDVEERTWLAFQVAYLGPLNGEQPFSAIAAARTSWVSGEPPRLEGAEPGPRGVHDPARGTRTLDAYRAWAGRAGSQRAAFTGEQLWTPERRFARAYERLALPGLHRDARFDLLVTLGALGVYELTAGALQLGGANEATVAAKRALGIGDPLLLERRSAELADACGLPLAALDLALHNWGGGGDRVTLGAPDVESDAAVLAAVRTALGL